MDAQAVATITNERFAVAPATGWPAGWVLLTRWFTADPILLAPADVPALRALLEAF